jgi:hypothetical protein
MADVPPQKPEGDNQPEPKASTSGKSATDRLIEEMRRTAPARLSFSLRQVKDENTDGYLQAPEINSAAGRSKQLGDQLIGFDTPGAVHLSGQPSKGIPHAIGRDYILEHLSGSPATQKLVSEISFDGKDDAKGISRADAEKLAKLNSARDGCAFLQREFEKRNLYPGYALTDNEILELVTNSKEEPAIKSGILEARALLESRRRRAESPLAAGNSNGYSLAEIQQAIQFIDAIKKSIPEV